MQRFGDQALANLRSIGIRGVDEVDAELHRAAQHAPRLGRILGLAPDPRPGDAHGAEAHAD